MRIALGISLIFFGFVIAKPSAALVTEHYDSRISDPLFRTGERFAIVVENHTKQNVRLNVHNDPNFFLAHKSMAQGLISAPSQGVAYKIFFKRHMGVPKFELEGLGSFPDEKDLQQARKYFDGLPGAKIDADIQFSISGPGNPRCQNVMPPLNMPIASLTVPMSYLNMDEDDPTTAVIYVTIPPSGTTCLAEFKMPGDLSWLDGGLPPAQLLPQPADEVEPEPELYALTDVGNAIEILKNQVLQFTGVPALVSGAGLVLNYAYIAGFYTE